MSYTMDAINSAKETGDYYLDNIVESLLDDSEAGKELLNDYPDGDIHHHENHVDIAWKFSEAADLIEELSYFEETDAGLWDGQMPREAITIQAAYTFGNAVLHYFGRLIDYLNDEWSAALADPDNELSTLVEAYNGDGPDGDDVDNEMILRSVKEMVEKWIKDFSG